MTISAPPSGTSPRFAHPALFYRGDDDYLTAITDFVFGGVMLGEPVMVAVPTVRFEMLRTTWGDASRAVEMRDMAVAGLNPGRIIGDILLDFIGRHAGHHVRIVGEPVWPDRDATEYPACAQHEALINLALVDCAATVMCPYDVGGLDPSVITDASRTHPTIWMGTRRWSSNAYTTPRWTAESFNQPLAPRPWSAAEMSVRLQNVNESRRFTASWALASGLPADRVADAVLAVDELVTNAVTHGGGTGRLSSWTESGRLVFEVRDSGWIDDPLAGRRPAPPSATDGRGLPIVHRLSDLVRVHTEPGKTVTRAYFRI